MIQGVPRNAIPRNILMTGETGRLWIRKVDEHRYANALAHIVLLLLLMCFGRQDCTVPQRLRLRERQIVPASAALDPQWVAQLRRGSAAASNLKGGGKWRL